MSAVLDACCGPRMMWFNRADPRAVRWLRKAWKAFWRDRGKCEVCGGRRWTDEVIGDDGGLQMGFTLLYAEHVCPGSQSDANA